MSLTILDGLKKVKILTKKANKKASRVAENCCSFEGEEPLYNVRELMQSHNDLLLEVNSIKTQIQRTNAATKVAGTKYAALTISELISYRQSVLPQRIAVLKTLSKSQKESESMYVTPKRKVVMHYVPKEREDTIDKYEDEILDIDAILDKCNMTTKLI